MRKRILGLVAIGLILSICIVVHGKSAPTTKPTTASKEDGVAEQALRDFVLAMLSSDEKAISKLSLDRPGREILWKNSISGPPHEEDRADAERMLRMSPIQHFKVGDEIKLPTRQGPRVMHVTDEQVNERRQLLAFPQDPLPWILVKSNDQWLVDPGPLIAARQAAERVRERQRAAAATTRSTVPPPTSAPIEHQ